MENRKQAEITLKCAVTEELSQALGEHGFNRRKSSLTFTRTVPEGTQKIEINFQFRPSVSGSGEAQILPSVTIKIPKVSDLALKMVEDKTLLANHPDIVLRQPLDLTAPKDRFTRWLFTDASSAREAVVSIRNFLAAWGLPFLEEYQSAEAICEGFVESDDRILAQRHWYIYVAAAYIVTARPKKAAEVLESKLGNLALRQCFAKAFEYVANLESP